MEDNNEVVEDEEMKLLDVINHELMEPPINKKNMKVYTQLKREHEAEMAFKELTLNRHERLELVKTVMEYGMNEDKRAPWVRAMRIHDYVKTGLPPKGA